VQGGTPSLVPKRRVRELRSLARDATVREELGIAVLEGIRLVTEALDRGAPVLEVYLVPELWSAFVDPARYHQGVVDESAKLIQALLARGCRPAGESKVSPSESAPGSPLVHQLEVESLGRIATSQHPQGALGLVSIPSSRQLPEGFDFAVGVYGIQDPGNLGTIARSAAAFGAGLLIVSKCADWRHPRALRASAGALMSLPVIREDDPAVLLSLISRIKRTGCKCLGAVAHRGRRLSKSELDPPVAVFLGSEAVGLPDWMLGQMTDLVTIQTSGSVESLNVAMAATVLCFEIFNRRSRKGNRAITKAAS
jgi:TrmH family RNA methyltransferase